MIFLKLEHFYYQAIKSSLTIVSIFIKQIQSSMSFDLLIHDIKNLSSKSHKISKFEFKNNLLYFKKHLYVPKEEACLFVLQACHDIPIAGYFGYNKSLELISRDFWWLQI